MLPIKVGNFPCLLLPMWITLSTFRLKNRHEVENTGGNWPVRVEKWEISPALMGDFPRVIRCAKGGCKMC